MAPAQGLLLRHKGAPAQEIYCIRYQYEGLLSSHTSRRLFWWQDRNVNNMELRAGDGNSPKDGDVNEPDRSSLCCVHARQQQPVKGLLVLSADWP